MKGRFIGLHARAFVHSTEVRERVEEALRNVVGGGELRSKATEGVHGNPIVILEADILDPEGILRFFSRLGEDDLHALLHTLDGRVDEGCNLFVKVDKQSAFLGQVRLGKGDDVISVRIRVTAFPAKQHIAEQVAREALEQELARRARAEALGR